MGCLILPGEKEIQNQLVTAGTKSIYWLGVI
jgi:hypothetical protein